MDGSASPAAAVFGGPPAPPPDDEGVLDWIAALSRLWPVRLAALALGLLVVVLGYKALMEHYAPAVRSRPAAPSSR